MKTESYVRSGKYCVIHVEMIPGYGFFARAFPINKGKRG